MGNSQTDPHLTPLDNYTQSIMSLDIDMKIMVGTLPHFDSHSLDNYIQSIKSLDMGMKIMVGTLPHFDIIPSGNDKL